MKAYHSRSKKIVEIHQWCNDWFMLKTGKMVSPSGLMFKDDDFLTILHHSNNGIMLGIFEPVTNMRRAYQDYLYTFKRRKRKYENNV